VTSDRQMTFSESVQVARRYEMSLSKWYQKRFGVHVLATYDYSGLQDDKAPKLMSVSDGLIVPDLLVCGLGRATWIECKWKAQTVEFRKTHTTVTGISARHFAHYESVKKESGCSVFIMFLHIKENEMRGGQIRGEAGRESESQGRLLLPPIHNQYQGDKFGRGGMVFWDWNSLHRFASLDEIMNA